MISIKTNKAETIFIEARDFDWQIIIISKLTYDESILYLHNPETQ